ncbi:MAG: hypothetical protein MJ138_06300, partial [Kiritimatiellae bacterium]|nr:hypothetical protein [Kiritimatiellia bacterium]
MAEEVEVIPEWKIKHAWAQCMKDPKLNLYFTNAPYGAKQYVALAFYCKVFADEVTEAKYKTYVSEVEAEMGPDDMKYVARNDDDAGARRYFAERLAEKFPDAAATLISERMEPPPAAKSTPHVEFPGFGEADAEKPSAAPRLRSSLPVWLLSALSFVLLVALAFAIVTRRSPGTVAVPVVAEPEEEEVGGVPLEPSAPAEAKNTAAEAEEERRDVAARALIQERQALEDARSSLAEERRKLAEERQTLKNEREAFEAEKRDFKQQKEKAMAEIAAEAAKIADAAQKR